MSAFPTNPYSRLDQSPRLLGQQLLRTTAQSVYETPSQQVATIEGLWLCNGTTNEATVRVHHVAPRASAGQANALLYDMPVPASTLMVIDSPIRMVAGEQLVASCATATAVTLSIYGKEGA